MKLDEIVLTEAPKWPKTKEEVETLVSRWFRNKDIQIDDDLEVHAFDKVELVGYREDFGGISKWRDFRGKYLPVKFAYAPSFSISNARQLLTLEGMPKKVLDSVRIANCVRLQSIEHLPQSSMDSIVLGISGCHALESLKGCPKSIQSFFIADLPNLKSFEYMPKRVQGTVGLHIRSHQFNSYVGISDHLKYAGEIRANFNEQTQGGLGFLLVEGVKKIEIFDAFAARTPTSFRLKELMEILNKYLGKPDEIFDCQTELIDKGLEQFAQI